MTIDSIDIEKNIDLSFLSLNDKNISLKIKKRIQTKI